jgi:hypothetical protein
MSDDREQGMEYLVIDGRLDRAGQFTARRCRSTRHVREWPVIEDSDVVAELLTTDGEVLHRELARVAPEVDCEPGDAKRFTVLAYIGLREEASAVRLRRDDLTLWTADIPPSPGLAIAPRGRPTRGRPYVVRVSFSKPFGKAHLMLVYKWGEGRFLPIYTGPPVEELELDLTELPGGESCRLVAEYSNGLRSTSTASKEFSLPLLGPTLTITSPRPKARVASGASLLLEGQVIDQERRGGARPDEQLAWRLDGEDVGRGPIWSVDGLEPGAHVVTLRYETEGESEPVETEIEIRVTKPRAAPASEWEDWDPTDEHLQ